MVVGSLGDVICLRRICDLCFGRIDVKLVKSWLALRAVSKHIQTERLQRTHRYEQRSHTDCVGHLTNKKWLRGPSRMPPSA